MESVISTNGQEKRYSVNPHKLLLWFAMGSMVMLFAAFTSAYIVRRAAGDWLVFQLPDLFWYSTAVIALSSLTMHGAYFAAKRDRLDWTKTGIVFTFLLGSVFLLLQWWGWEVLMQNDIAVAGNPAGSFVYVITGAHLVHLVGGLFFLLVVFLKSIRNKISSKNILPIELCMTYWHFLDGLWIYLFFFLLLNR